ncbi:MAG TPA: rhomboid family intramembrane serine protease, partial [Actinomycetota bacterium]|nr:rhomboid family intramembrane serine protease [Actinomycetota bacterium]
MPEQPCAFHPDRMTGVSCSRCDRPICSDDMYPAPVGQHCPICAGKMREGPMGRTGYRVRTRAERIPAARFLQGAQVTTLIVGVNVIVFALMLLTGSPTSGRTLRRFGALTNPLPSSQWWRLITATFVHLGFAHIALNMLALILFGGAIEQRYGKARYLFLYLGSGVLGSATSLAYSHSTLSAGASGAIFGIIGSWLALVLWNRNRPGMRGQLQSWIFLVVLNIVFGAASPGIDLRAHLGGLVGGFV